MPPTRVRSLALPVARRAVRRSLLLCGLAGVVLPCCRAGDEATTRPADAPKRVVCSFLPVYIFTKNVVGRAAGIEVELMLPATLGCPHDYELSMADAKRIAAADVIILNGGIENFAGDAIARLNRRAPQITAWTGCELLHGCAHDHEHGEAHDHAAHEANAHVWLSPIEAVRQVENIARGLAAAFPDRADTFRANAADYGRTLEKLRAETAAAAKELAGGRIVTTHDAFAYLARDLGLEVVATLQDTPRADPLPSEMAKVVATVRATRAAAIFTERGPGARGVAASVSAETGVAVRELDPITIANGDVGPDEYELRMRRNLQALREALR